MRFDVTEDRFGPFVLIYCCNASLKICKLLDLALVKIAALLTSILSPSSGSFQDKSMR